MHIAFSKHALLAGLSAASLGLLAPLAAQVAAAFAGTTGATATTTGATAAPVSGGASPTPGSAGKTTLATWFGPGFYGHSTACGQKMSPALVGVASRTLACGTLVQIGYRGQRLTVPVLDRGPYGNNATWDLTAGAARALEIKDTVRVSTQIVGSVPNTPTLGEPATSSAPLAGAPSGPLPPAPAATAATTGGATAAS
jgi:rare lipoprotein A (peptidoglycan hydrolase)